MDTRRVILYAMLAIVIYSLWTNWQQDYGSFESITRVTKSSDKAKSVDRMLPAMSADEPGETIPYSQDNTDIDKAGIIHVKTDVLSLEIDLAHGDIIKAELLQYPVSVEQKNTPITLLKDKHDERYVANSSLFTVKGQAINTLDFDFSSVQDQYQLTEDDEKLVVTLKGKSKAGLMAEKQFIFNKNSYLIDVRYQLENQNQTPWKGYMNTQLLRTAPTDDKSSMFQIGSYTGASYSNPGQTRFKKVSFKDMAKSNLDVEAKGGWVAMQQHYFLSAWVPPESSNNRFYSRTYDGLYGIGAISPAIVIKPGQTEEVHSKLYIGPEITSRLQAIAPALDMTIDYGWLWFLSSLLFSLMKSIYSVVGNWGWSIVLVTVLIKLAFYRLSATSYKSMAAMRKLQPKLQALRERYSDDKAKISQATMELYRKEKVNPLGGCLPIVIQIPVFIALYWVLIESVQLRQAPFILWIQDLAEPDPYHILPVIMGITMLIQQKLNPAPPDPTQAKVMMFLPVVFTALFWNFPSGLVLYWIVNNTLSILQQWYITRKYSDDKSRKKLVTAK